MSKKVMYTLEYPVRCSPVILYEFLSTPAGLQEWFADRVDFRDNVFSFSWNGTVEKAEIVDKKQDEYVRLRWLNGGHAKDEYFEFQIQISEVTNETILIVKDFADKKEISDQSQLWDYQIKDLFHRIGN
jgi:START-like superfamily domain